ncbi:quinone-dependent dihydroorotate dehydrogenase [Lacibacterium aquatile]|uniref:Dihydroorotate dehydrogenase (quinone) n=1 Tax=Lacibacterium aquatile TaxID=1168082 RepID=A0ABW5DY09_9PROT
MFDYFPALRPILHRLDPEEAHLWTLRALELGIVPTQPLMLDAALRTTIFGKSIDNPIGLAAGFDKNARVFHKMYRQGFGFTEIGGVTPRPQAGNPRPRLFRLAEDEAVINRMGFNNDGMEAVRGRLVAHRTADMLVGVNLAANIDSEDPADDFVTLARRFSPHADFLTLDISCPNTANGKMFLSPGPLQDLLDRLSAMYGDLSAPKRPALAAKIAPDIEEEELDKILEVLTGFGIDAMILSNTTIDRPEDVRGAQKDERGGMSGRPLFNRSTALLSKVYAKTGGKLPLVGVGGVSSAADAYLKIRAGASVVQLYTALVFQGPAMVTRLKLDLADMLRRDGFQNVAEAIGADHR